MTDPAPHLLALYLRGAIKSPALPGVRLLIRSRILAARVLMTDDAGGAHVFEGGGLAYRTRADLADYTIDTSDPVTAAAILLLVREAWGDPGAHTEPPSYRAGRDAWIVVMERSSHEGPTELDALIAALAARVAVLENTHV